MVRKEDWIWKLKSSQWWINSVNKCVCCNWNRKGNVEGWHKFWRTFLCGKSGWKESIKVCCSCWNFFLKGKWNPALSADNLEWWQVVIIAPVQRSSGPRPCVALSKQRWFAQSSWAQKAVVVCHAGCYKQPKLLENSRKFHRACLSFHWFGLPGSGGVEGYVVCVNFVNAIRKGMCWCRKKNTNIHWPSQSAIMLQRFFWLQL